MRGEAEQQLREELRAAHAAQNLPRVEGGHYYCLHRTGGLQVGKKPPAHMAEKGNSEVFALSLARAALATRVCKTTRRSGWGPLH